MNAAGTTAATAANPRSQFVRIEHYAFRPSKHVRSKKGRNDVAFIVKEALRVPMASQHVKTPRPPTFLHGDPAMLATLPRRLRAGAQLFKDTLGRTQRVDCPVLLTVIFSFPEQPAGPSQRGSDAFHAWKDDSARFTLDYFRGRATVEAIVLHEDESHRHLHVLVHSGGSRVHDVSPGYVNSKRSPRRLRQFLDLYQVNVGSKHNLARTGPNRKRTESTKEHKEAQQELQSLRASKVAERAQLDEIAADIERQQQIAATEKARAGEALAECEAVQRQLLLARKALDKALADVVSVNGARKRFEREKRQLARAFRGLEKFEQERMRVITREISDVAQPTAGAPASPSI